MLRDATCPATRRAGGRCASTVLLPSGFCAAHDPDRREAVAAARAKGGRHKSAAARVDKLVPASLRPVLAALMAALGEVHGDGAGPPAISPAQAGAMASLAGAIVRVYQLGTP